MIGYNIDVYVISVRRKKISGLITEFKFNINCDNMVSIFTKKVFSFEVASA